MRKKSNKPKPEVEPPEESLYLLKWEIPRPTEDTLELFAHSKWSWVESCVWTPKMCSTLERGVKGGKWFSLIDKVWKIENLRRAFKSVKANRGAAGIDRQTISAYESNLEENLVYLSKQLKAGQYIPKAIRRCYITKPGRKKEKRPIGISTVRDRIVQTALRNVIEPIFENEFAEDSCGFRPRRSAKDALREVRKSLIEGKRHILDADIQGYFDEIGHDLLMDKVRQYISDSRILHLIESYLKVEIDEKGTRHKPSKGSPQGSVISPLLANLFLNDLDHLMVSQGYRMIRYADDFIVLCDRAEECDHALQLIESWCETHKLTLHPDKTKRIEVRGKQGINFLGYFFIHNGRCWISPKSLQRSRENLIPHLKRCNRHGIRGIIELINPKLRGYYEYFKQAGIASHIKIDGWVRMRLRSIIKRQNKGRGIGRGKMHQEYPNAYFADLGLFSLEESKKFDLSIWRQKCYFLICIKLPKILASKHKPRLKLIL